VSRRLSPLKASFRKKVEKHVWPSTATIKDRVLPDLRADFKNVPGDSGWILELDPIDAQTINFSYPQAGLL
jgi:hypothetical protein